MTALSPRPPAHGHWQLPWQPCLWFICLWGQCRVWGPSGGSFSPSDYVTTSGTLSQTHRTLWIVTDRPAANAKSLNPTFLLIKITPAHISSWWFIFCIFLSMPGPDPDYEYHRGWPSALNLFSYRADFASQVATERPPLFLNVRQSNIANHVFADFGAKVFDTSPWKLTFTEKAQIKENEYNFAWNLLTWMWFRNHRMASCVYRPGNQNNWEGIPEIPFDVFRGQRHLYTDMYFLQLVSCE